ncbi:MAG: urate oxidase [Bryobacteraceae bacterium]|nr:urate oxidase [Bryobacteraceae bacterium]
MEQFTSGWKRNYYGKGDVNVYRLQRDGQGEHPFFGANVKVSLYGDAFWPTYTHGDNTGLIATDSMKNFIQRETLNYHGGDLFAYCRFLAEKFLGLYPQVEGLQISASEIPYRRTGRMSFTPAGPEARTARLEMNRTGVVEAVAGVAGFRLLRLGGSAFTGFVRDEYTTLPEIKNRPLHMWLDLEWTCSDEAPGVLAAGIREITFQLFDEFESGSIQEVIYQLGTRLLATYSQIAEVHLEANNRTWDTVAEQGDVMGVFTEARPPYGCLGLRMKR